MNLYNFLIQLPLCFVNDSIYRFILSPFGKSLGIKSTRTKRATPNPILEAAYNKCSRIHHKTVSSGKMWENNSNNKMCTIIKVCPLLLRQHIHNFTIFVMLIIVYVSMSIRYNQQTVIKFSFHFEKIVSFSNKCIIFKQNNG